MNPETNSKVIREHNNNGVNASKNQYKESSDVKEDKKARGKSGEKDNTVKGIEKPIRNSDENLENIIDEIIKSTPNPTISFKSNEFKNPQKNKKKKPKKYSRESFEKEMRDNWEGKTFKQVSKN